MLFLSCKNRIISFFFRGGVRISDLAEVLTKGNKPIVGLYGAGEVTGGVHGANRLVGNSLLECVVFGRRAGLNAAKQATNKGISRRQDFVDNTGTLHESGMS